MNEDEPAGTFPSGDRPTRVRGENGLNDQTQRRIGNHLRALYDSVVQQPIPDHFRDLIARLEDDGPKPGEPSGP
ncbi:NepR family anti-sigma factor [Methylorubrum aminovorans]|nr:MULTISPECIES: NepR family anti-sigma factor [unclassified Methylobacterium]AWI89655.1 anti-sigma factor [Methylobacterium sp. DM1]QIJ75487.1 anti-sigma factor [Methylobacterium sp. CLZ]QIJ80390.1 anti-sigma factor [Methylobacterium sp. NI91]